MSKIRFTKEKIDSCPFCGGKAGMNHETINCGHNEYHEHIYIECTICGARSKGVEDPYFASNHFVTEKVEAAAVQQWNRRAVNTGYIDTDSFYCGGYTIPPEKREEVKAKLNSLFGRKVFPEVITADFLSSNAAVEKYIKEAEERPCTASMLVNYFNATMERYQKELVKAEEKRICSELIDTKKLVRVPGWMWHSFEANEVYCCCVETKHFILSHMAIEPTIFVINCLPDEDLYIVKDPELKEQFLSILAKKGEEK